MNRQKVRYSPAPFLRRQKRGTTLIEVVATLISSSILLLGLTSCILLSQQSLDIVSSNQAEMYQQRQVLDQFRSDLREAVKVSTPAPKTIEVVVPDRNGDLLPDKVTYVFPELKRPSIDRESFNLTTKYSIGVSAHSIREPLSLPTSSNTKRSTILEVVEHSVAMTSKTSNTVVAEMPGNTTQGDMLVAIIGTGNAAGTLSISPGSWTPLLSASSSDLKVQIWWRLAEANETSGITFSSSIANRYSTTIIRVRGHNGTVISNQNPIIDTGIYPRSQSCTTTANNMLAFQVLVAKQSSYNRDLTGLYAHTNLVMESGGQSPHTFTLGLGYRKFPTPTNTMPYTFLLTESQPYITCSFAIGALQK